MERISATLITKLIHVNAFLIQEASDLQSISSTQMKELKGENEAVEKAHKLLQERKETIATLESKAMTAEGNVESLETKVKDLEGMVEKERGRWQKLKATFDSFVKKEREDAIKAYKASKECIDEKALWADGYKDITLDVVLQTSREMAVAPNVIEAIADMKGGDEDEGGLVETGGEEIMIAVIESPKEPQSSAIPPPNPKEGVEAEKTGGEVSEAAIEPPVLSSASVRAMGATEGGTEAVPSLLDGVSDHAEITN